MNVVITLVSLCLLATVGTAENCRVCGGAGDEGLLEDKPYCVELSDALWASNVADGRYGTCRNFQVSCSLPFRPTIPSNHSHLQMEITLA